MPAVFVQLPSADADGAIFDIARIIILAP